MVWLVSLNVFHNVLLSTAFLSRGAIFMSYVSQQHREAAKYLSTKVSDGRVHRVAAFKGPTRNFRLYMAVSPGLTVTGSFPLFFLVLSHSSLTSSKRDVLVQE